MSADADIALILISNLGTLILFVIILRGVFYASRVNFYNPLSQMIVKLTNPLLTPLRGALPAAGRIDWAVWVLAVLLQSLILAGIAWGKSWPLPGFANLLLWGIIAVIALLVRLYLIILVAMIIVSWIAPGSRHPVIELIWQISEPVMAPFRSLLPNMGGVDFSPILVFIGIQIVQRGLLNAALTVDLPLRWVVGL
jgi:YggT family protein